MIQLVAIKAALSRVPWKIVGVIAAWLVVAFFAWRVMTWKGSHEALPSVQAALASEEACADGSKCAERVAALRVAQEQISAEAVAGYERELADLRNRPVPRRVIRVCSPGDPVRDAADPGGTAAAPGAGLVHEADEFDTGPLRDLARQADEVAAAYRWLRARDDGLAQAESVQPSK